MFLKRAFFALDCYWNFVWFRRFCIFCPFSDLRNIIWRITGSNRDAKSCELGEHIRLFSPQCANFWPTRFFMLIFRHFPLSQGCTTCGLSSIANFLKILSSKRICCIFHDIRDKNAINQRVWTKTAVFSLTAYVLFAYFGFHTCTICQFREAIV